VNIMLSYESYGTIEDLRAKFDDCGRRWAERMMDRLRTSWLEVPLVWPGTQEQALTIVHALGDEWLSDGDRESLAEVVQNGARLAWRDLVRTA
jgi:hypothetical protein